MRPAQERHILSVADMWLPSKGYDNLNSFLQRTLSKLVNVQPHERAAMLSGFAYFFCLLCSYYLLRPLRDAMGLKGGAAQLQWLFTATFLTMLLLVPVFGAVASRWPPRRFVPLVYRFFSLNILGFGILFAAGVHEIIVSRIFFVWTSVFNLFAVSIFWSVMADRFSNEQGRRLFGFIAAGGTAGALAGPALTAWLVVALGPAALAVTAAVLLELAVHCFMRLAHATHSRAPGAGQQQGTNGNRFSLNIGGGVFDGVILILKERYLLAIVIFLLLHSFASTFLYFEQGRIVAQRLPDTGSRTQFFALVDLAVSCSTIALQALVTGRFIHRFGVTGALLLLPLVSLLALFGIAIWPGLIALATAQGARRAIDYAIVRPAREVLFTVVSRPAKYKAKSVIETVVFRGGDAVSGWMFAALATAGISFSGAAILFAPFAAAWTGLAVWLGVSQEKRARSGTVLAAHENASLEQGASIKRGFE
ncbi:MAG: antiporter, family [Burkholderiales bacterium]